MQKDTETKEERLRRRCLQVALICAGIVVLTVLYYLSLG